MRIDIIYKDRGVVSLIIASLLMGTVWYVFLVLYTHVVVWYNYVKVSMRYGFVLLLLLWLDGVVGCFCEFDRQ